jgi:hypothetical protein
MTILGQHLFFPRDFTCMIVISLIVTEKCDGYVQVIIIRNTNIKRTVILTIVNVLLKEQNTKVKQGYLT